MTETKTIDKPSKGKDEPKKSALDKMLEHAGALSDDEREELRRLGVTFPGKISEKARKGEYTWGLRCVQCGEIAVYYVEDEWSYDGQTYDEPPSHVPIDRIAWTQDLPSSQIDRHSPRCPGCAHEVDINVVHGRKLFRHDRRRLVRIADYNAAKKVDVKAMLRQAKKEERQALARGEAPPSAGSPSYELKGDKPSEFMPKEHVEAIRYLDQRYDLAGNLGRILQGGRR